MATKKTFDTASAVKGTQSWTEEDPEKKKSRQQKSKKRHNLLFVDEDFKDFQTYARAKGTSANALLNEYIAQCVHENTEIIEIIRKFRNGQEI